MSSPIIDVVPQFPEEEDKAALHRLLKAYNAGKTGGRLGSDFAILLRDPETGDVMGGLWAEDDEGWAFVKYLYIPAALRGLRLGARLIDEAEEIARGRGMTGVWLNTYEFQARGFYEKMGYEVFGALEGGEKAHGQFFMRKRLEY